uniref:Kininogen 1 n=1 Tax=Monodelphis domestica TaxID=13616 RepID=F7F077_MONDO
MKLAVVLLLVTSQLNVQGESEVSCQDNDVFRAMDAALTEYNNQKTSGNQFVLHQIMAVSLTESSQRTFTVTYNIQEGDCHVRMGKNWKECGIKKDLNKERGQCTAIVKSHNENEFTITEQHCKIIPVNDEVIAVNVPCLGCYRPISANDEDLQAVLNNAVEQFNYQSQSDHLYTLKDVLKALRQVVRGWNYDLEFTVVETNCVKSEVKNVTSECKPLPQGKSMACRELSHVSPEMKISSHLQTCQTEADSQFSDMQYISGYSPELKESLRAALENFNSENESDFYFKPSILLKAHLVEPGEKHSIEIQVQETECSKEKGQFSEDCEFKTDGRVLQCIVQVPMGQDGEVKPVIDCHEPPPELGLMKRPSGFSPFRSALRILEEKIIAAREPQNFNTTEQEEEQTPGKAGYPHDHGHGWQRGRHPVHGTKNHPGSGLGHKHGHNHSHGRHRGHDLGQGNKHKHGQGHWKHEKKPKKNRKSWMDEYPYSPTEENFPSSPMQEETQGPPPPQSPSQQGVDVTPSYFQDFDLLDPNPTNIPVEPTAEQKTGGEEAEEEVLFPDIPIVPKSPLFTLMPDFPEPEPIVPKCPGSPWQPITVMNPVTEESQNEDFELSDALSFGKK